MQDTPVHDIEPARDQLLATFLTGVTRPLSYRKKQLKSLGFLVQDNEEAFIQAIVDDLGRPSFETIIAELNPLKGEINEAYDKLDKWAKPEKVSTKGVWNFAGPTVHSEPKGATLIIGTWNYPIMLVLGPLIGALSAGCTALIKPAEQAPATAALIAALVPKYLDPKAYIVVNGAIPQTTELLRLKWDHIFYTGSGNVGKIIARAAAEHLTSTTLELGGKSPAVVLDDADLKITARRIAWGKHINSSQTCITADYVLCTPETAPKLIEALRSALESFNPSKESYANQQEGFGRIVNSNHFARVSKLLEATKGTVVIGGTVNKETGKIEVTVVNDVKKEDALMEGEIFGPILPIVILPSLTSMISYINSQPIPLALYIFTRSKSSVSTLFTSTRSGTFLHNETMVQFAIPGLPFGGAGASGLGNAHGKYSFDAFTHKRAAASVPGWMEKLLEARYPPYTPGKLKLMLLATGEVIKKESSLPALGTLLKIFAALGALLALWKGKAKL